ncbi:hypothetical protein HDV62DRAFT_164198 [Trichoderma sp. SZMC 28011]
MSSNKRRKLDPQAAPSSAVSALSALAARRRLVANVPAKEPSSSPEPEESASARTNSFSVLQTLRRQNEPPKSPKKNGSRGPLNRGDSRGSISQGGKMSDPSTPEAGLSSSRVMYSSFLLNKNNCRTTAKGTIALKLRDSERFIAIGSFGIKVIAGEATVFGATLQPSDPIHWIHAPHCHAIPVIRTSEKTSLELHHDPNADGLRRLSRLSPLFRGIWGESKDDSTEHSLGKGRTFQIVCSSDDAPKKCVIQELSSPPAWNKKLADLVSVAKDGPFTTLVCGPKSAGKSTFSKMLVNRIFTSEATRTGSHGIAILDLDPGQPEYAPCGTISLVHIARPNLSAAFTHPNLDDESYRVIRCHALASMTPAAAPEHYLECVLDLLDYYRRLLRNCHLLINTPGWILGTGQDLLVEIISRVNPPEVIYMSEDGPADVVEVLRGATKRTFTTLPSQPSEFASRTAAHLRAMQAMSYFHLDQKQLIAGLRPSWNPSPLSSIPPLQVRYSGNQRGILGILLYDYQSPSELLSQAINGMILAAVDVEDPKAFRNLASTAQLSVDGGGKNGYSAMEDFISRTTEGLPYIPNASDITLDPCFSRTIGLVLIRGIDTTTQTLQLLTPIPLQTIEQIRSQGRQIVLVHGKFDAPTWAYTEDLYGRSQQDDINADKPLEIVNEDPNEDEDEAEDVDEEGASAESEAPSDPSAGSSTALPWVEVLRGSQKRPVGSRVWRVRRDLGRNIGGD